MGTHGSWAGYGRKGGNAKWGGEPRAVSKLSCLTEGLSPRDSLIGERDSLGRDEPGEVSASSADRAMWAANPSAFVTHLFQSPSCPYFSGQAMLHQPPEALHAPIRGHPNIAGRFLA
jgi:hypothetical protein